MHGSLGVHVSLAVVVVDSLQERQNDEHRDRNKESIANRILHVLLQNERCLLLSIKKESLYYLQLQL